MSPKDKDILDRIHKKYYGKKKDNSPSSKEGIVMHAGASRNELMLQAKEKGIKNFRVLNKQELTDALANIGDQKKVDMIVAGAVARWKSGWGKKERQPAGNTKGTSHPKESK